MKHLKIYLIGGGAVETDLTQREVDAFRVRFSDELRQRRSWWKFWFVAPETIVIGGQTELWVPYDRVLLVEISDRRNRSDS